IPPRRLPPGISARPGRSTSRPIQPAASLTRVGDPPRNPRQQLPVSVTCSTTAKNHSGQVPDGLLACACSQSACDRLHAFGTGGNMNQAEQPLRAALTVDATSHPHTWHAPELMRFGSVGSLTASGSKGDSENSDLGSAIF